MSFIGCTILVIAFDAVANLNQGENQIIVMYRDSIVHLKGALKKLRLHEVTALPNRGLAFFIFGLKLGEINKSTKGTFLEFILGQTSSLLIAF